MRNLSQKCVCETQVKSKRKANVRKNDYICKIAYIIEMGFFNFCGDNEHRVFSYKPIYYDPQEEERKRKFGAVDGSLEKEQKETVFP